jgi:hypothetical protein
LATTTVFLPGQPMVDESQTPDPPSTVTVRMDYELVRKARIICAHTPGRAGNQLKLVDYLDSLVRGLIEKDYDELMTRLTRGEGKKKGGGKS